MGAGGGLVVGNEGVMGWQWLGLWLGGGNETKPADDGKAPEAERRE